MRSKWMILLMCCTMGITQAFAQDQACPSNISFSTGDLSFWAARTGLLGAGIQDYPAPNSGRTTIPEFNIANTGIRVITSAGTDLFGGFTTLPTINGYTYGSSIQLGSSATSFDLHSQVSNPGGFTRSVTYTINVPPGPVTTPYTMTYAYALVLENGTHNSNEQPLFKATLTAHDTIVTCASPQYYLPTFNNGGGSGGVGATLDTATALANGFTNSPVFFLSHAGTNGSATLLQDVWTKNWTEVTFDLSPYRGTLVTLTFETDNCLPGAHFAYAYVALRNNCAGLEISGDLQACANTVTSYSIPALAGAFYNWTIPASWTLISGANSNVITVVPGATGGMITANEINGCANLKDTINVTVVPPTVPGRVLSDNTVCSGTNSTLLTLNGATGGVLNWLASTDGGASYSPIANTNNTLTAQDLTVSTIYRALVQNGSSCLVDTSDAATILVDPKSVGGVLSSSNNNFCLDQTTASVFNLTGNTGPVVNWQFTHDNTNWSDFNPIKRDSSYSVTTINQTTAYRVIVKSGVCPADTSSVGQLNFINVAFPRANIDPPLASICYGKTTPVNARIDIGTNYSWTHSNTLTNAGNGTVPNLPYNINATAAPTVTTDYVLTVSNAGCPNTLRDTFHVDVAPRIIVFAGNDTAVVVNQPLQLNATVNQTSANIFTWIPATGLNFTNIPDPIATLGDNLGESITYVVRAENAQGCYAEDDIKVTIFKTGPDIFIPSGFTPNGDGKNDIVLPICVGIKQLNYFRIYNRWGQLVFATSQIGKGWDGRINGSPQATNNFVYMAQAVDYLGHVIFKKGNIVLIK